MTRRWKCKQLIEFEYFEGLSLNLFLRQSHPDGPDRGHQQGDEPLAAAGLHDGARVERGRAGEFDQQAGIVARVRLISI